MNITQYKDGNKSVKMLSLSELVETMRDPASGRIVKEFREKLDEYPPGYPCPGQTNFPKSFLEQNYKRKKKP